MGVVRRSINMILALALTVAGAAGLVFLLFYAAGWRGWMVTAAGSVFTVGILWLWSDFIDATPNEEL